MKMTTQITTLEQAGKHLVAEGVVNFENMTVEGKQLLEVCGYSTTTSQYIDRQIKKHNFVEGVDFKINIDTTSESRVKPKVYIFTMNAASIVYTNRVNTAITKFEERKESRFGELLKSAFPNEKLVEQFPVKNKRVDFYFPTHKLAIEYDELHHKNQQECDSNRQEMIKESLGCKFIRVPEGEEGAAIIKIYNTLTSQKNL